MNEWIAVSEGLPPTEWHGWSSHEGELMECWVATDIGIVEQGLYNENGCWYHETLEDEDEIHGVTHWQPIFQPAHPEAGGQP